LLPATTPVTRGQKKVYLRLVVLGALPGRFVDPVKGNTLDN